MQINFYLFLLMGFSVYFALASPISQDDGMKVNRELVNKYFTENNLLKRAKPSNVWVEFCEAGGVNCVGHIDPYKNTCFSIFGKKTFIRFHSSLLLDRNSFTLNTASLDYKSSCPTALAAQTFIRPQTEKLFKINTPGVKYYFSYPL